MSTPSGYPAPGERIGPFLIERKIGAGGMGVVFLAIQESLSRRVALKVISPELAHDEEFRTRFIREAHAQGTLDSPHVVHVYAHGEEDGYLYIATQYIADGDLSQVLRNSGPLSVQSAIDVIAQVADGLQSAHDAGMVHRDVKPANVLVRRRSGGLTAYITDFGVARVAGNVEQTRAGFLVGTPTYQAPELHLGAKATPATDVYSLGCLLWATLAGKAPYRGSNEYQVVKAHLESPVPQLPQTTGVHGEVNRILSRALAKQAHERYASAQELRADLLRVLPHAPRVPAVSGGKTGDTRVPPSREPSSGSSTGSSGGSFGGPSGASGPSGPSGSSSGSGQSPVSPGTPSNPTPHLTSPMAPQPVGFQGGFGAGYAGGPGPSSAPPARRRWLAPVIGGAVLLVTGIVSAVVVLSGPDGDGGGGGDTGGDSQADQDRATAAEAIDTSYDEQDDIVFGDDYGVCVADTLLDQVDLETLVSESYLTADYTEAQAPNDVDSMSQGTAEIWADAQLDCQDWEVARQTLKDDPEKENLDDADIDDYVDCTSEIDRDLQRNALIEQATGDSEGTSGTKYGAEVLICATKLI